MVAYLEYYYGLLFENHNSYRTFLTEILNLFYFLLNSVVLSCGSG